MLYAYGDPHGTWEPLFEAELHKGDTVILMGDMELQQDLRTQVRPLTDRGIQVLYIIGNHDFPQMHQYDYLPPELLLSTQREIEGLRVSGISGVFKGRVWYPKENDETPIFADRAALLAATRQADLFRGGLPLRQRETIFKEDVDRVEREGPDIVVSHEAPSSHPNGFIGLDRAGRNSKLWLHGHHHAQAAGVLPSGCRVECVPIHTLQRVDVS